MLINSKQLTVPHYLFTSSLLASIFVLFTTSTLSNILNISAQSSSNELDELINKGIELYDQKDYEGAIKIYDKALAVDPTNIMALINSGAIHDRLGNYTEAIEYYDKALMMEPNDVATLVKKGYALDNLGNYTQAVETYDMAIAVDPNSTYISDLKENSLAFLNGSKNKYDIDAFDLVNKGSDEADLGNYTGAIEYYNKALTLVPNDTFAMVMMGITLQYLGNYTGAIEYFDEAQTIEPGQELSTNKGLALAGLGNYTGAIEYFDEALSIDPYNVLAKEGKDIVLLILSLMNQTNNHSSFNDIVNSTNKEIPPSLQVGTHLIRDSKAYAIIGDGFNLNEQVGVYIIFNNNKSSSSIYKPPVSEPNLVQISDSHISVDIAFKIPVFPNSTLESVERIEGLYDVKYIDTQPDYTKYIAFSNSPITINNTQYLDLTIEVKKFNNDTGFLFIDAYK